MKYGIVVDSSCDMNREHIKALGNIDFTRVALKLDIGDTEFVDNFDLDIEHFMKEMYAYKGKTGSAAPSPGEWQEAYEKSEYVFAITITGALSGSYASARAGLDLAKENNPDCKIHLIDSKATGPKLTLLVKKLADLMAQDLAFEDIVTQIDEYYKHIELLFVLKSLDNLVKNGRVSKLTASIAGILGIKLLGTASKQGELEVLHKCRGKWAAYDKTVEEMYSHGYKGGRIVMAHCFAPELAEYVSELIRKQYPAAEIDVMPTSGLDSFYSEQGGLLVGFEI